MQSTATVLKNAKQALLRSIEYYISLKDGSGIDDLRNQIFSDMSEDYARIMSGPKPETNLSRKMLEDIASDELEFASKIKEIK